MHTSPIKGEFLFISWQGWNFCLLQSIHTDSGTHPISYWMADRAKCPGFEVDNPVPVKLLKFETQQGQASCALQPTLNQALFTQFRTQWVQGTPFRGLKGLKQPSMRLTAYLSYRPSHECMELYSWSIE